MTFEMSGFFILSKGPVIELENFEKTRGSSGGENPSSLQVSL